MRVSDLILIEGGSPIPPPPAWPPPPRAPLPPFPQPINYDHVLPYTPPSKPDLFYYRGGFCDVRVPGLPLLPEMSGFTVPPWNQNQEPFCPPIMSLDVTRYISQSWELVDRCLDAHRSISGYTHFQASLCHALAQGVSRDDFLKFCKRVQAKGMWCDVWFQARDWPGWQQDGHWDAFWKAQITPWFDALLAEQAMDLACVGWQLDGGHSPGSLLSCIRGFAERLVPAKIPIGLHWINHANAWFDDWVDGVNHTPPQEQSGFASRFDFWRGMRGMVSLTYHQYDVNANLNDYQGRVSDVLAPFGDGRVGTSGLFGDQPYKLVVYESSAQAQFDLISGEDEGDLRDYLINCTNVFPYCSGYGNGGRLPSGAVL